MGQVRQFDLVVEFIKNQSDLQQGKGATPEDVRKLELEWGAEVPMDYRRFLQLFGWVVYGSTEVPGLGQGLPLHLDLSVLAHAYWDETPSFCRGLLPIYDSGGGWCYCLSNIHAGMPVVVWALEFGENQPYDERYESWTDWFWEYFAAPM